MALDFFTNFTPYLLNNISNSFGYFRDKNQILDPITTSVRLSLLQYKQNYTKLGIDKNRIFFQEPKMFGYQGIMRTFNGDQKSDIHIIILSIENLLHWYKISDKKIRYLCEGVVNGLEKLSQCYSQEKSKNLVSQTIDFFTEKIRRELGEIIESKNDDIDCNFSDSGYETILSDRLIENDVKYDFFKSHWNDREIRIIYDQMKELEIDDNIDKRNSIIKSIENFLTFKDDKAHKHISNLTKYTTN